MTTPAPMFRFLSCALCLLVATGCASGDRGVDLDPGYFALGALSEYVGYRVDLSDDRIETFNAGKAAHAIVFARYLVRAADEAGLDNDIVVRSVAGGCTAVSSGPMKAWLVSRYPAPPPVSDAPPDGPAFDFRYASREMLPDRRAEISWLAGVRLGCSAGDTLVFPNAGHKARLTAKLLTERGARAVEVTQTPRGHYPTVYTVTCEPSPEIAALFAAVDAEIEAAKQDDGTHPDFESHLR